MYEPSLNIAETILRCVNLQAYICGTGKEFIITDLSKKNISLILESIDYSIRYLLKLECDLEQQVESHIQYDGYEDINYEDEEYEEYLDSKWLQENGDDVCDNCNHRMSRNHDCDSAICGNEYSNDQAERDEQARKLSMDVDDIIAEMIKHIKVEYEYSLQCISCNHMKEACKILLNKENDIIEKKQGNNLSEILDGFLENKPMVFMQDKEFCENFQKKFGDRFIKDEKLILPDYLELVINKTNELFEEGGSDFNTTDIEEGHAKRWKLKYWYKLQDRFQSHPNADYSREECFVYNTYYLQQNFLKLHWLFKQLICSGSIFLDQFINKKELRILDLGSGPGTLTFAIIDFFNFLKNDLNLTVPNLIINVVERNKHFIEIFKSNETNIRKRVNIDFGIIYNEERIEDFICCHFNYLRYDIIMMGNVVREYNFSKDNEGSNNYGELFESLSRILLKNGLLIVIETQKQVSEIYELKKRYFTDNNEFYDLIYGKCKNCGFRNCGNIIREEKFDLIPLNDCIETPLYKPTKFVSAFWGKNRSHLNMYGLCAKKEVKNNY